MSQARRVFSIMQVDLSYFFRTKWLMATLVALSLSDMLVLGLVFNGLMSINYFLFYVPGVVIAGMFAAALDVGRRVYLGLTEGVTQYYLSLPVSETGLVWAHLFSGGLGGTIYSVILLVVALAVLPQSAWMNALILIPFFFILSMGLSGIAAVLNLFSRQGERYWVFAEGLQFVLLGLSTVFYPLSVLQARLPAAVSFFVQYNPLSQGTDVLRAMVFGVGTLAPDAALSLVATSLVLLLVGAFSYRRVFSKVREMGKV
jgi:ABC-2 type transport system permease protein